MPNLLLAGLGYGRYISEIYLIVFLLLFFAWLLLLRWAHQDVQAVKVHETYWTTLLFASGAAGIAIWLLIPIPFVGPVAEIYFSNTSRNSPRKNNR